MKRVFLTVFIAFTIGILFGYVAKGVGGLAQAAENIRIYINGQEKFPETPPLVVNSRTMVPLRFVAEALGAAVDWDNTTQSVKVTTSNVTNEYQTYNTSTSVGLGLVSIFEKTFVGPNASETAGLFFKRGNDLWYDMTGNDSLDSITAMAYIQGVVDALDAVRGEHITLEYLYRDILSGQGIKDESNITYLAGKQAEFQTLMKLYLLEEMISKMPSATTGHFRDIILNYLKERPEIRHQPAALLVWSALSNLRKEKTYSDYLATLRSGL